MTGFLAGLIAGMIVMAVGARLLSDYKPRPPHLKHITNAEFAVINALGDVMFPSGGDISISARDAGIVDYIDKYMTWHASGTRILMHLMFFLVEHATVFFVPSWRRMSQLGETSRISYLKSWEYSRFYFRRMVFQSLRALMCMGYLGHPDVLRATGYQRPAPCEEQALV